MVQAQLVAVAVHAVDDLVVGRGHHDGQLVAALHARVPRVAHQLSLVQVEVAALRAAEDHQVPGGEDGAVRVGHAAQGVDVLLGGRVVVDVRLQLLHAEERVDVLAVLVEHQIAAHAGVGGLHHALAVQRGDGRGGPDRVFVVEQAGVDAGHAVPAGREVQSAHAVGHFLVADVADGEVALEQALFVHALQAQQAVLVLVQCVGVGVSAVLLHPGGQRHAVGGHDGAEVAAPVARRRQADADGLVAAQLVVDEGLRNRLQLVQRRGHLHAHLVQPVLTNPHHGGAVVEIAGVGNAQHLALVHAALPHVVGVAVLDPLPQLAVIAVEDLAHVLEHAVLGQRVEHVLAHDHHVRQVARGHHGIQVGVERSVILRHDALHVDVEVVLVRVDPGVLVG